MTPDHHAPERDGDRWAAHPSWARALRLVIRLSPVCMAALASWLLSRLLPTGTGLHRWLVIGAVIVVSVAVGVLTERLARRLLPLSALLALTMLFPDQAPSRWKAARSARARAGGDDQQDGDLGARSVALLGELTAHDRRTRGHAERVRVFAEMLGEELRLGRDDQDRLRWAALLHDVGKIEVASSLLNKPGKPTGSEWRQLREHPDAGARLAGPLVGWLGEWGPGIAEHHERFDGSGYPRGLAGGDISRAGRALAVVDAYEVMTAARSYKRPMNVRKARAEVARSAGTHFDPLMVRAFLAISLPRLLWTTGPLSFCANLPFFAGLQAASRAIPLATAPTAAVGVLAAGVVVAGAPAVAASPQVSHPKAAAPAAHAPLVQAAPTSGATSAVARVVPTSSTPTQSLGRAPLPAPPTATASTTTLPGTAKAPVSGPEKAAPGRAKKAPKPPKKVPPGRAKRAPRPPRK